MIAALRFRPYPEVPAVLADLRRRGLRLVVVSNWDVSLHDQLAGDGLGRLVDGIVSSAELGAAKPAPAAFTRALTLAGVPPEETAHVGDRVEEDVEGARAVGIAPVLARPRRRARRRSSSRSGRSGRCASSRRSARKLNPA